MRGLILMLVQVIPVSKKKGRKELKQAAGLKTIQVSCLQLLKTNYTSFEETSTKIHYIYISSPK